MNQNMSELVNYGKRKNDRFEKNSSLKRKMEKESTSRKVTDPGVDCSRSERTDKVMSRTDFNENIPPDLSTIKEEDLIPTSGNHVLDASSSSVKRFDDSAECSLDTDPQTCLQLCRKRGASSPLRPINDICASGPFYREQEHSPHQRRVLYVWNLQLVQLSDALPRLPGRASTVHSLLEAYGLLSRLKVVPPVRATKDDLLAFHSQEFVEFLESMNEEEDSEKDEELKQQFGIGYDCPSMPRIFDFSCIMTGATLRAVRALINKEAEVSVNWCGGWHHAKRDEAAGFCYVNDIVLAILKMRECYDRVLYVDLDLHHGDAVEDAFSYTPKVMTVSFHKHSLGFYPGSGGIGDVGVGRGRYYSINVPLQDGITDALYYAIFVRVMKEVKVAFPCDAVVVQCGADSLTGDPMNSFNLTTKAPAACLQFILSWKLPLLVLGGGGYHNANTARLWTQMTAMLLGVKLGPEIPDHAFFLNYGPDYQLDLTPTNRPDLNSRKQLKAVLSSVSQNLKNVQRHQEKLRRSRSLE